MPTNKTEQTAVQPGHVASTDGLGHVAEVRSGRLRWHLPTPAADPLAKFLDNDTHPLYDQDALDAAVATERDKWRGVQESRELLRSAARGALTVLQREGTKYGRLCEQLRAALEA